MRIGTAAAGVAWLTTQSKARTAKGVKDSFIGSLARGEPYGRGR